MRLKQQFFFATLLRRQGANKVQPGGCNNRHAKGFAKGTDRLMVQPTPYKRADYLPSAHSPDSSASCFKARSLTFISLQLSRRNGLRRSASSSRICLARMRCIRAGVRAGLAGVPSDVFWNFEAAPYAQKSILGDVRAQRGPNNSAEVSPRAPHCTKWSIFFTHAAI